jgi:predicted ABC-type ATPase
VKLYFLTLPDPEFAIRRVERRVRFGGHDIPTPTIRRRLQNEFMGSGNAVTYRRNGITSQRISST